MKQKQNTLKKSKVDIYVDGDCLVIKLSGILTIRTVNTILSKLNILKKVETCILNNMLLDLSDVYPVQLSGAVGLVCLCSALVKNKVDEIFIPSNFFIYRPHESVLTYLVNLNFFTQMSNKAKLLNCEDLVNAEFERARRREECKRSNSNNHPDYYNQSIIWPMEIIPCKGESISSQDFENITQQFINQACNCFEKLFSSAYFNFDGADHQGFWLSNLELFKNVFEHSNSWGLCTIHARPNFGTAVCYYDIGVGFKGSVNTSLKIEKKFETDYESINWALLDGHSSKPHGTGYGLTIVQDFVVSRNGIIEIRSGDCLFQKKTEDIKWNVQQVPWFPGVQTSFFIPSKK